MERNFETWLDEYTTKLAEFANLYRVAMDKNPDWYAPVAKDKAFIDSFHFYIKNGKI